MLAGEASSPETRAARPLLSLDYFCIAVYERNRTSANQVSRLRNIAKLIPPPGTGIKKGNVTGTQKCFFLPLPAAIPPQGRCHPDF